MARRFVYYDEGTPQARLLAAVESRFPGPLTSFLDEVAAELNVTRKSAGGTFYGLLRGSRGLPDSHRDAYIRLLRVEPELLDELDAIRELPATPKRRDRLAELEAKVDALTVSLDASRRAHAALQRRVSALEPPAAKTPRSRPAAQAKRRGQRTA